MTTDKVFVLKTTNLDFPSEGHQVQSYHKTLQGAYEAACISSRTRNDKEVVEDQEGKLQEVYGKSLSYTACEGRPTVYHRSFYGNYRCATYVETYDVLD